jgi:hypothetical protein
MIDRTWYFDLFPKINVIQQSNMKQLRNKTRRKFKNNNTIINR